MDTRAGISMAIAAAFTGCLIAAASATVLALETDSGAAAANPNIVSPTENYDPTFAQGQVNRAARVVRHMSEDPQAAALLAGARGVFIVPRYRRVALGIGGRGGEGILVVKRDGRWSDPVFGHIGGISIGVQAGAESGPVVLMLNSDRAVRAFEKGGGWSFDVAAGLTVLGWSRDARAAPGNEDVAVWSDVSGLFGAVSIGVIDIRYDREQTSAFYARKDVAAADVIDGGVAIPTNKVAILHEALLQADRVALSRTRPAAAGTQRRARTPCAFCAGRTSTGSRQS